MQTQNIDLERLANDFEAIVGKGNVSTNLFFRISHAVDPMPYDLEKNQIPYLVIRPRSTKEILEILKYANASNIPVHIHGSGTALHGAARPKCNCILLDTCRLNSIDIREDCGYVECGAGVRALALNQILEEHGYFLPILPGSARVATIGGLIAVNTSAHSVDSSVGKPGDYVLGLEVALPTGERIETGTRGLRRPSGIDLTRLFIGSEGLLGVITKVRMRLVPKPKKAYGLVLFNEVEPVARSVMRMYRERSPLPLFLEFLDKRCAQVGFELQGLRPPIGVVALIETTGLTEDIARYKIDKILDTFNKEEPLEASIVDDEAAWQRLWGARSSIGSYICQNVGPAVGGEVSPELCFLCKAIRDIKLLSETFKSVKNPELYLFGHIGAPSLHPYFVMPQGLQNGVKKSFVKEVRKKTEELNLKYQGCGGEWGQSAQRVDFYKKKYGKKYFSIVQKFKTVLDPNNILNRGNLDGW